MSELELEERKNAFIESLIGSMGEHMRDYVTNNLNALIEEQRKIILGK